MQRHSMLPFHVIERLRADAEKLRTDDYNTAQRYVEAKEGEPSYWRCKKHMAADIEYVLALLQKGL